MKRLPLLMALVVVTIIFGTIEVTVQQAVRMGANDPQIQLAEDTAAALNGGALPANVTRGNVDIRTSLAPSVTVYDTQGNPLSSSGLYNHKLPRIPVGVLKAATNRDYNFVSWQPDSQVRIATVSVAADKYFVMSGRSLKEVEKRESQIMQLTALGWGMSVFVILAGSILVSRRRA